MKHLSIKASLTTLFVFWFSLQGHAETTECSVINRIPAVINSEGLYCFKNNLNTSIRSGNAIEITTNNVTIDFNGFKLIATLPGTYANGVYANNRKNITLRNGSLRGFQRGIYLGDTVADKTDSGGHLVENNHLDSSITTSITIYGNGNTLRNNQIINTGGSNSGRAYGIFSYGPGVDIRNNKIDGTYSEGGGAFRGIIGSYGIAVTKADASIIMGNSITRTRHSGSNARSHGISRFSGSAVLIKNNFIINGPQRGTVGISGGKTTVARSHVVCMGNIIMKYGTALSNCSDRGGNVILP